MVSHKMPMSFIGFYVLIEDPQISIYRLLYSLKHYVYSTGKFVLGQSKISIIIENFNLYQLTYDKGQPVFTGGVEIF